MKMTSIKCATTIISGTTCSYVYSSCKLHHIFICSTISADQEGNGNDKQIMFGNSSTKFGNMQPCMISMTENEGVILFFIEETKVPPNILHQGDYHIGALFTSTTWDIAILTGKNNFTLVKTLSA